MGARVTLFATGLLLIAAASSASARPSIPSAPSPHLVTPSLTPASTVTIPAGTTVGPQNISGNNLTNNGTINGGSSVAVTSTGPGPTTVVNNGTITSNVGGLSLTGGSSSIINTGTITVGQTIVSTGPSASATATITSGIRQSTKP